MTAWPPERIEQLRQLVAAGMIFREIAALMGITKGAAIGKAQRMGFTRDADAPLTPMQLVQHEADARRHPPSPPPCPSFPPPGGCLWPHGHPREAGFHFCAERVASPGLPYCSEHFRRAYIRAVPKARAA